MVFRAVVLDGEHVVLLLVQEDAVLFMGGSGCIFVRRFNMRKPAGSWAGYVAGKVGG